MSSESREPAILLHKRSDSGKSTDERIEHIDDRTSTAINSQDGNVDQGDHVTLYPNRWATYRSWIREPAAEFLGTMILIIFGTGVDCQVVLTGNTGVAASAKGSYLSISFGWGIGTALGVWFASGVSGGHLNPAVTIALATFRDFPWRKVPYFILAQILGALCGSAIIYADYYHAISLFEGGDNVRTVVGATATAPLFSTYALDYLPNATAFFDEFLGTAILLLVVCSISDKRNGPPPAGLNPLVLFLTVLGIGACLGAQTAYAINPARDLGPRLMTYMVGYGTEVWNYRSQYWLWCPIIAPIMGALAGVGVYDLFIFEGEESIVNKPNAAARRRLLHASHDEKHKAPAGADSV